VRRGTTTRNVLRAAARRAATDIAHLAVDWVEVALTAESSQAFSGGYRHTACGEPTIVERPHTAYGLPQRELWCARCRVIVAENLLPDDDRHRLRVARLERTGLDSDEAEAFARQQERTLDQARGRHRAVGGRLDNDM
jgi:hypothetical protein